MTSFSKISTQKSPISQEIRRDIIEKTRILFILF